MRKAELVSVIYAQQKDFPEEEEERPKIYPVSKAVTPPARTTKNQWKLIPEGVLEKLKSRYPCLKRETLIRIIKGPTPSDGFGYVYCYHEPFNMTEFKIGRTADLPVRRIKKL